MMNLDEMLEKLDLKYVKGHELYTINSSKHKLHIIESEEQIFCRLMTRDKPGDYCFAYRSEDQKTHRSLDTIIYRFFFTEHENSTESYEHLTKE